MQSEAEQLVGAVFSARWRLMRLIGEGGMGSVYEAHSVRGEGVRAIKVLHPEFCTEASVLNRFFAEAQAVFKTPEWQAAAKQQKFYTVEVKPDGTFNAENVVPGNYTLNFTARAGGQRPWEHPPIAQGSAPVTVPDSFSPSQPVDAGEIPLNPSRQ